jgi:hypothetical protein
MRLNRGVVLGISFLIVSSIAVLAQAPDTPVGRWSCAQNNCDCGTLLTIWEDGRALKGTINFPGDQADIDSIDDNHGHISFSVNRRENDRTFTYAYDANISGRSMTGTCANQDSDADPETLAFQRE